MNRIETAAQDVVDYRGQYIDTIQDVYWYVAEEAQMGGLTEAEEMPVALRVAEILNIGQITTTNKGE